MAYLNRQSIAKGVFLPQELIIYILHKITVNVLENKNRFVNSPKKPGS